MGDDGADGSEDEIDAELDEILTDEVMEAGDTALAGWCTDSDVAAYAAFVAMWRAIRKTRPRKTQLIVHNILEGLEVTVREANDE
jgi:hypothetical protein